MYTKESLIKANPVYESEYGITDADVETVNNYIKFIESTRSVSTPKNGDIVELVTEQGDYYENAHLEFDCFRDENEISYCEKPYVPFISESNNDISCSTSGGAWGHIPVPDLKYTGVRKKTFCYFGGRFARAHGAIYFTANVSVWQYDCNKMPYSTKTHDKYYIYKHSENSDYAYSCNGHAWKTEKDFQAWLRTNRGICLKGNFPNQMIVWTYKTETIHVSLTEYDNLDLPEDTILTNCRMMRCKREYDDKRATLKTYFVWYWNESGDFYENLNRQNKIREQYYANSTIENQLARTELDCGKTKPVNLAEYFGRK